MADALPPLAGPGRAATPSRACRGTPYHPVLRLVCLALALTWTARLPVWGQALWLATLGVISILHPRLHFRALSRALGGGVFLYLAVALVYPWWTPGVYVWPALGAASPTWEGLALGGARMLLLACLIATVSAFMQWTPRQQVLDGVFGLVWPLRGLGLPAERLALRLGMVLDLARHLPALKAQARRALGAPGPLHRRLAGAVAALYDHALEKAEGAPRQAVVLRRPARPAVREWLPPLVLALLIVLV